MVQAERRSLKTFLRQWLDTPTGVSTVAFAKSAFKIALAATIALVLANWWGWNYPFYAVIAAIIVMGSTASSTLQSGVQRLIGTVIGAVGGAIFAAILGSTPWGLAFSVFLLIFLGSCFKLAEAAKLSGYVSAIIILNYQHSPWVYAWGRFLDTLLGVGVALLVNRFIFPFETVKELRRCLADTLINFEQFYQQVTDAALGRQQYDREAGKEIKDKIIALLQQGRSLWAEARRENATGISANSVNDVWEFLIRRIWEHILTMEHTVLTRKQDQYWQMLAPHIEQLADISSTTMLELATAIKTNRANLPLSALEDCLEKTTHQINSLQNAKQDEYSIDELLRFFTFFYTMEEIGRKLQRIGSDLK